MRTSLCALSCFALLSCAAGELHRPGGRGQDLDAAPAIASDASTSVFDARVAPQSVDEGVPLPEGCAVESCGNGLDDDCDGTVDNGCVCTVGEWNACFGGQAMERNVGVCRDGRMLCEGFEFGEFGTCEGDILAGTEICDAEGLDEDCDGVSNEGCDCVGDEATSCGTDEGECRAGVQRCVDGQRSECEGAITATAETCDGRDEDCDGSVDEGLTQTCGTDTGSCTLGTQTCTAGAWGSCNGIAAIVESCNAQDDDCDGNVDENITEACGSDVGSCASGVATCSMGTFGICAGEILPSGEACNGSDDDCDGNTDETLARACGSDVGVCSSGIETCSAGHYGSCVGLATPTLEECDGLLDEDCDGTVDEGCDCTTGARRSCGTDVGACMAGTESCTSGRWSSCVGQVSPTAERCDGIDNDCDGIIDEGCDCRTGTTRSCGTDVGECTVGRETCDDNGRWGICLGSTSARSELCNRLDDDCDGAVDEGDVCPRLPPVVMCPNDLTVFVGDRAALQASASDPDGGEVQHSWEVVSRPAGTTATPSPRTRATTTLVPDAAGSFVVRYCATDDEDVTTCCTSRVTATNRCTPPAVPDIAACGTSYDRRPIAQFSPVENGVVLEFFADGVRYGETTVRGQNYFRPSSPLNSGAPPPGRQTQLSARACRSDDRSCCSATAQSYVSLIESCTTPVAPTSSNIVFSEYVVDGDGACSGPNCEAGEAIEITNLSHCPLALDGSHFSYCNGTCSSAAYRWMNFTAVDVVPPRGVYVAIRNREASMCSYPFFQDDDAGLFGLRVSTLRMEGPNLENGWFNNMSGPMSQLRIATGTWSTPNSGTTLERVSPYLSTGPMCGSIGFDAIGECGDVTGASVPSEVLAGNQLGRLWHPCDAVVTPVPSSCR